MRCPACRHENPAGSRFCNACGAGLPAPERTLEQAERRHLTVLFCDLVDSTRLAAGLDPEDWRELVRAYQAAAAQVVDRLEGHVAQYLGDGLLVYFGYPRAHEDDAERAVRAGLGILHEIGRLTERLEARGRPRLAVRIGVHTGPVVVGEMGGGDTRETLAIGETVNLAARLQEQAEPDSLVLSTHSLRLVQGVFVTRDLGERSLKGLGPVRLHQALRPSGMRSRLDATAASGLTSLVGRSGELALLDDQLAQVLEGRGRAVLARGEAGIGKSRLVQAFRERLAERAHTWLECRSSPYTRDSALYPLLELQRQGFGFQPDDSPERKVARLERALEAAGFELDRAVPLLASLHSLPPPERYAPLELGPEGQRAGTRELLVEWLLSHAREQPLVLLVEDLHWLDPSTLELLGALLERIGRARVLLLVTCRPPFEPAWGAHPLLTSLPLARLTRAQTGALVGEAARARPLSERWVEEIVRRSDGVPLFAEELTRALLGPWGPQSSDRDASAPPIPETLQGLLMARLDALGPVKELAQLASVLGRDFSSALLSAVSPLPPHELERSLSEAVDEGLLVPRGTPPDEGYVFRHALIQEAAYQSLLRATRQRHHRRVAETLIAHMPEVERSQPELVAHHLSEADDAERAIGYWQRAGERAHKRAADREALRHLQRALELLAALPESAERDERELRLQVTLGASMIGAEGPSSTGVETTYARARALCRVVRNPDQLARSLSGLAFYHVTAGNLATALELGGELVGLADAGGPAGHRVTGNVAQAASAYFLGRPAAAVEYGESALRMLDGAVSVLGVSARTYIAWALWCLGEPDRARLVAQRAVDEARTLGHAFTLADALAFAAVLYKKRRERDAAEKLAGEAIALSERHAFPMWLAIGKTLRGWSRAGRPSAADEVREGIALLEAAGNRAAIPHVMGILAEVEQAAGRRERALAAVDGGLALSRSYAVAFWDAELERQRGELLLAGRDGEAEAERALLRALEVARGQQARSLELRAAHALARLWRRQGRRADGYAVLQPVHDAFGEGQDTPDLREARQLLGELTRLGA
jgi:class 3 adenylate cyclase